MPEILVRHVDPAFLVVEKPAGVLSVPGRGDAGLDSAAARVQRLHADALVVHRLDMATSGLLLFARGAAVQRALSMAFAARRVHKRYEAVVHGEVAGDAGEVAAPLAADWPNRPRQVVDTARGRPALTRWRVLERRDGRTRLELEPVTGRSHQLRVHLQSIGHPIVGDALYGPAEDATGEGAPGRLLLHATRLAFAHPVTGAAVAFASEAPFRAWARDPSLRPG